MRSAITERVADRYAVGMKAISTDLGLTDHALAQIVDEIHCALGIPLADAPANNCLLRPGHADEHILIALGMDLMALDVLLLLADEGPCLIKLEPFSADADH